MYHPTFPGPIEGWMINYNSKNFWRVARSMEWDDLSQEGYLVFMRCASRYPIIDTPQHFMSLFKRAWINQFNDLANADTQLRAEVSDHMELEDGEIVREPIGDLDHNGDLVLMIAEAPREVVMVLNLFLNAPAELLEAALASWNGEDRRRKDGGSGRICRLLGLPEDLDVLAIVRNYFRAS